MTDRSTRGNDTLDEPQAEETVSGAEDVDASAPSPGPRRPLGWWIARVALVAVIAVLVLTLAGLVVYDYGTMWPPSAEAEAAYKTLVAEGKASAEPPAPGFRIPIPGCVCHAADADLARKAPGHAPDPILVVTHRYRTFGQCFTCHGGKSEAGEGIVRGEPGNQPVIPAQ